MCQNPMLQGSASNEKEEFCTCVLLPVATRETAIAFSTSCDPWQCKTWTTVVFEVVGTAYEDNH